ncbi:MAG: phenylalanine--tRNA ligase subunit alpha [bacterium]
METKVQEARRAFATKLGAAATLKDLEAVKNEYMGRKGIVRGLMDGLKSAPGDARPRLGKLVNDFKVEVEAAIAKRSDELSASDLTARLEQETLDVTLPGIPPAAGKLHILTQTTCRIMDLFLRMGFDIADGPEIETEWYNFEALNIPEHHPARDAQDSFYLNAPGSQPRYLLRTHTSPVQVRYMQERDPPIRMVAPGKVYRRDPFDARHSPVFHQVEGLVVGDGVSFADLKGMLTLFCRELLDPKLKVKFRPSYFQFTEPSAEVHVSCFACGGTGERDGAPCKVCTRSGWIELGGAGMVHPNVFRAVGRPAYDPAKVQGYAFGIGIDRMAMLVHDIDDIRLLFENDLRFLRQF